MNKKFLAGRVMAAILVGLAVIVISVLAVWRMSPETLMNNRMIVGWTRSSLRRVDNLIHQRIERGGSLPKSLREISPEMRGETFGPNGNVKMVRNGVPIDGWGRPLRYSSRETSYTLESYGRDGKPGGSGFDYDLSRSSDGTLTSDDKTPIDVFYANPPMPSLHQFLFELPTAGMLQCCILSGAFAFIASFYLIRPSRISWKGAMMLGIQIAITIAITVLFATIIMQLHIPTGH